MKDVFVLVEIQRGKVSDITFEMLGKGREVADSLGYKLFAVLLGDKVRGISSQLGVADGVLCMEHEALAEATPDAYLAALEKIYSEKNPEIFLIGYTNLSMGLGGLLSSRFNLPFINYCRDIRTEEKKIVATCTLYGGKIEADVVPIQEKVVLVVYSGVFPADKGRSDKAPAVEDISPPAFAKKIQFEKYIEPEAGDVDITKQDILVAVGRGMQNKENLSFAEEVAGELGGVLCASRPIIDQGWLPMTRQVGKSGMIVKPKLYIAAGISGAPEHQEGMKGSKLIIAINSDAKAPIFDISHYGVVGDALEILPLIAETLKRKKGG